MAGGVLVLVGMVADDGAAHAPDHGADRSAHDRTAYRSGCGAGRRPTDGPCASGAQDQTSRQGEHEQQSLHGDLLFCSNR
jgi:hypothetical protein